MSDDEEIDVQAILARINSNLNNDPDSSEQADENSEEPNKELKADTLPNKDIDIHENTEEEKQAISPESKKSQILVVRDEAENTTKLEDPLKENLKNIALSPAIASNPEKFLNSLDHSPLLNIIESVRASYNKNLEIITENQRNIFENIIKNKFLSDTGLNKYDQKNLSFLKMKNGDIDKKINEIKTLELDTQKSKYYLLMLIKRLEELETKLDSLYVMKVNASIKK